MAECRDLEPLLATYVDGEAPPEQRASVDAHISRCPPCRGLVAQERAARDVLAAQRQRLRPCAPQALRARCAAQRAAAAAGHPALAARLGRWVPLSLAATLLLSLGGLFLYSALHQGEALAAQLALDHVKCFQFESAPQDPATAAARWAAANGWTVQVPASAPERHLEFVSLRRCLVTEGRTAHMMYKWRGEPLSLFVMPEALADGRDPERTIERFGHEAILWSANDRTYAVLARGHPSEPEIRPVVKYMKANVR
jgi:anti-sigma factor RsiW